jgi:integrase
VQQGTEQMARTVRDANLQSREARGRLKPQGKPYYRTLEEGLHLGYRKPKSGTGKWVLRHYVGAQTYSVETIGSADDQSDADGDAVLNFKQAQSKARELMVSRVRKAKGKHGPITVADAIETHLQFLESNRKTAPDARYRADAFILPKLGKVNVVELTSEMLRRWHVDLAKAPARLRTSAGETQRHRETDDTEEGVRRRRSTANRILTVLKAALNHAWHDGRVPSDAAWRRVTPFEGVDANRVRYLTVPEAQRVINAASPDFRDLVQAALVTGARYGELARLDVSDFNPDAGTVAVRQSKSGKPRPVALNAEGVGLFARLCAGRAGDAAMLPKANGRRWGRSHQKWPMAAAAGRARLDPPASFHSLRHTYCSLAIMNGVPLLVVAKNLGHRDTRMVEKHYGHLAPSYIADAIREGAPRFGIADDQKVKRFGV